MILSQVLLFAGTVVTAFTWMSIVLVLGRLAAVASAILFSLLLIKIGSNTSSQRLSKAARSALIWFSLLIGFAILGVVVVVVLSRIQSVEAFRAMNQLGIFFISSLVFLFLGLGTLLKYLSMVRIGIDELNPQRNE